MLGINSQDRTHLFIDGLNLHGTLRSLHKKMDYLNLIDEFKKQTRLVHANYYTTIKENADDRFHGVLDFLELNGYTIISKDVRVQTDSNGHVRTRGTMLVEIATSLVTTAIDTNDHLILFSGDGELVNALEVAKERGSRVTVISDHTVVADEIRRICDEFIPITSLPSHVLRGEDEEFVR